MRIIVLENDAALAEFIQEQFECENFKVDLAASAAEFELLLQGGENELALLDIGACDQSGLELLRRTRSYNLDLLFLVLSEKADPETHLSCLNAGADDFVTKPFYWTVLLGRCRALLRRRSRFSSSVLKVEDLELDRIRRTVKRNGCEIDLTQKEFALLEFLMERPMQPVPRAAIAKDAWKGGNEDKSTNTVDVYINYVRRKIESYGDRPLIRTVRGVGYQIGGGGRDNREQRKMAG